MASWWSGLKSVSVRKRAGCASSSAPGRTEIGGNHTDHNNGRVLAAAVNLDTIACVSRTDDNAIVVDSEGFAPITVELDNLDIREKDFGTTLALIRGTAGIMKEMGYKIGGFARRFPAPCCAEAACLPRRRLRC
ncbi:MAG: galactokinase family protein [Christensenellales bacterium]